MTDQLTDEVMAARQFYAEELRFTARIRSPAVVAAFAAVPRGLFAGSPSISPRPPYFATNRTSRTTIRRATRFTAKPGITKLPASSRPRCAAEPARESQHMGAEP